ncbi:8aea2900-764f-4e2a-ac76-6a999bf022c0 [Thermothielavioides terrestris]|uniref:8aea2900-764f-4e2a-ac76-6a999bf022c0 n=1 Tax=Thermothielavioides terrestris TaxID=2587410 RepID=A0A3S4AQI9_9PEZI|nr:8aea2900-764f-4e2a-ac76-6a999bf022c0 [Thermothielavioides terrestris]
MLYLLLWTQYHGLLIRLYEPALRMRPAPRSHDPRKSAARTEALSNCLQAVADFFAAYAKIPLDSLSHMPLVATAYMAFAFVTSSRLLILHDADWDVGLARRAFDFPATCQNLSDRFRQADALAESLGRRRKFKDDDFKSVLAAYSTKISWIRQWCLAKVSASGTAGDVGGCRNGAHGPLGPSSSSVEMNHSMPSQSTSPFSMPQELDEEFWNALLDSTAASNSWMDS